MVRITDILKYLKDIKEDFEFGGDASTQITGFSSLNNYIEGNMTWIKSEKNIPFNINNKCIALVICQEGIDFKSCNTIFAKNSKKVFLI